MEQSKIIDTLKTYQSLPRLYSRCARANHGELGFGSVFLPPADDAISCRKQWTPRQRDLASYVGVHRNPNSRHQGFLGFCGKKSRLLQ